MPVLTAADLAAIRAVVREELAARPLRAADRAALEILLPALAGRYGSAEFTTGEALADPALERVTRGWTARAFGRLLARARGAVVNDLAVERIGAERRATLWRVGAVSF